MKKYKYLAAYLLLGIAWSSHSADAQLSLTGAGGKGALAYQGPGDIKSGAFAWFGLRAYNVAYSTGSNPAVDVCDVSTGLTCSTINILSSGFIDRATALASSACAVACAVSKIYDQSGNGRHFTAASANRPALLFAGCPVSNICLKFNGSGIYLRSATSLTLSQPLSMSMVTSRFANPTLFQNAFRLGLTNGPSLGFKGVADTVYAYAGGEIDATAADSALHAIQELFNNASSDVFVDGTRTTGTAGTANSDATEVWTIGDNGANPPNIYFYEAGAWSGGFSNADEAAINSNQHGASGWNF